MPIVVVTLPNDGEDADAADVDNPINAILAVLNGNIDQDNLADGGVTSAKLAAGAVTSSKLGADAKTGWNDLTSSASSVTNNGQHSYDVVFNSVNLTSILSNGMRLKLPRTVAPPTQNTFLNGSNQAWRNTSPSGITFTDDFTVAAWVKLSSLPGSAGNIVSRWNGTSGWYLQLLSNGQVEFAATNGSNANFRTVRSFASVPVGKWVRISAQLDMSGFTTATCKVQIDNVDMPVSLNTGGTNPTSLVQAGNLEIGSANGAQFFPGKISQVALFNALISASTLKTYSGQTMTGSETNCIGLWKFNGDGNDSNSNANNLTAQGSAVATNVDSPMNSTEYGIIMANSFSTNTTVTVQTPEGYSLPTSGGLGTISYSSHKSPYGFPLAKEKWQVGTFLLSTPNVTTASAPSTWQPLTGTDAFIPIGSWNLSYLMMTTGQIVASGGQTYTVQVDSSTPVAGDTTQYSQTLQADQYNGSVYLVGTSTGSCPISLSSSTVFKLYGIHLAGSSVAIYMERGPAYVLADNAFL
jgi:hypothetical protein